MEKSVYLGEKMTKLIAFDPGSKGCVVELDLIERICRYMTIPYREDGIINGFKIRYNFNLGEALYIAVEQVTSNPIFGHKNNFAFGGYFKAVLQMLELYPYELITPQKWQSFAHDKKSKSEIKDAKERTAAAFRRLNPNFDENEHKADGLKDAFFIAYYCGIKNNIVMPKDFNFQNCQ